MRWNLERKRLTTSAAGLIVALIGCEPAAAGGKNCGLPGGQAPSRIVITRPQQGEQPLVVEGQVVRADGKTPAAGIVVYVYHTDATGHYNQSAERDARPGVVERAARLLAGRGIEQEGGASPRLRGWVRTDAQGRYAYRTIRPAPYPGHREAAHVHTQLWGDGVPPQWGTTLLFADDRALPAADRQRSSALGRFGYVCPPNRDAQGAQRCRHDIRLKASGDSFEANTRHGFTAPRAAR